MNAREMDMGMEKVLKAIRDVLALWVGVELWIDKTSRVFRTNDTRCSDNQAPAGAAWPLHGASRQCTDHREARSNPQPASVRAFIGPTQNPEEPFFLAAHDARASNERWGLYGERCRLGHGKSSREMEAGVVALEPREEGDTLRDRKGARLISAVFRRPPARHA